MPVWAKNKNYEAWMSGQHIYASYRHTSLLSSTFGMPVGIDNSYLMPPTIPAGKREDSLFTFLLHGIHHGSLHLEFPWAIAHKREARDWRSGLVEQPADINLAQLIMSLLADHVSSGADQGSPETRLIMLGAALTDKSTLSEKRLKATLSTVRDNVLSAHCQKIRRALEREDLHDPQITADIEQALKVNMDALIGRSPRVILADAHFPSEEQEQLKSVQQELVLFGQALLIWPVLWKYCAENPNLVHEATAATASQNGTTREEYHVDSPSL